MTPVKSKDLLDSSDEEEEEEEEEGEEEEEEEEEDDDEEEEEEEDRRQEKVEAGRWVIIIVDYRIFLQVSPRTRSTRFLFLFAPQQSEAPV